jgi:hypothetical protein
MYDFSFKSGAPDSRPPCRRHRPVSPELQEFGQKAVGRAPDVDSPFESEKNGIVRLTQARGRLDEGIEDRLQIERRAADDHEHISGGSSAAATIR